MSPEELATIHPRLFHVTAPEAVGPIRRRGLLPTSDLLASFGINGDRRRTIERARRSVGVIIEHETHGIATITDNAPLSTAKLTACLDDGLTPEDWMLMLNRRAFFWPSEKALAGLLGARLNRRRTRAVLVIDTLRLARRHADRMELSAINSGATLHRPARRGLATFTPLGAHPYQDWRRLRGGRDIVKEVTVVGPVTDIDDCVLEVRTVDAALLNAGPAVTSTSPASGSGLSS